MLNKLLEFSLRQKFVALGLVGLMIVGGVSSLLQIPINSLPDVTPIQVLVITKAGRYSPYEVENLVSFPLETTMNGLPDVKEVRSISQFGLSVVTVEFEEGTDIYFARQLVSQRLQSVTNDLPSDVSAPVLGPISTALGEIYQYEVRGENHSLTELRTIQDWIIAPQLKTIKGVTEINSFGGFVKQYLVEIDPIRLNELSIRLEAVFLAIQENNRVAGGNYLVHNREQYIIRGLGTVSSIEDMERIVVTNKGQRPIYLGDIATIKLGQQLRQGGVTRDGRGEAITGIIMMLRGGNGREVIAAIEEKLQSVAQSLPENVYIEPFYDQSELVDRTTQTVEKNLLEGGFFVIAVLLLLLGEIKGALIVASVIPLSMLFAFIGMEKLGLAANLMSLGAIDFGMVVDGSVVMVENIVHRLHHNTKKLPAAQIILQAGQEVARPILFGVLIILVVYIPIMTFSGIEGILFRPMAITVVCALLGSLMLTFIYVPALSAIVFRNGVKARRNYIIDWLRPRYHNVLNAALNNKKPYLIGAVTFLGVSISLLPFLGTEFLPELEEGSILVEQIRMPSVTLEESMNRADALAAKIIAQIPEVKSVIPKTGRSDLANDWMGVHQTDVFITLKPEEEWRAGLTKQDIIDEIEPMMEDEIGLEYNFTQPIAMRVDELTSGVKSDIAIKLFGENLDSLQSMANTIAVHVNELNGTSNFYVEKISGQPYLTIKIDRRAVASYGLNVNDVQRIIEAGIGGQTVSQLIEGQRRFDILIRYPQSYRDNILALHQIPVPLPKGKSVPLSRLARIVPEEGARQIYRENGWRRLIVGINIKDIDIGTYVGQLQAMVKEKVTIPSGHFIEYGGAFENQQRAMKHLLFVVPLSLAAILGLLYLTFGKLRYALLIFMNLPFALSGGILLLWARGLYLSVSASIGFVALFGVAVLNGIVLISHLNHLRERGKTLHDSIIDGATDRLRPVLMTALVASLGFIPMAFNTGPGSEVQRPLATVVIGGLVTSTLLTLLILPLIYQWIGRKDPHPEHLLLEEH